MDYKSEILRLLDTADTIQLMMIFYILKRNENRSEAEK